MAYTVKQLATLSGVSVRTLHFYDEIGLVMPAYIGENQYRYYEEPQLLLLQQVLFYRELGFPLAKIQEIIKRDDFDREKALLQHKRVLKAKCIHISQLIKTIDKTIIHLRGKEKMQYEGLFSGFNPEKQKAYEQEIIEMKGETAEDYVKESHKRTQKYTKSDWEQVKMESIALNKELGKAIDNFLQPDSPEVQALVQKHYNWIERFYTPTKEVYVGLGKLYCEHPDFRKNFERYHHKLPEFLSEAIVIFSDRELD